MQVGTISAILELIVLSVPSGIYLAVRARRGHRREARALVGLAWPTSSGWVLAVGVFVIATALGYAASRGIAAIHPALLHPGATNPRAAHTGGGTAGLSVTTATPAGAGGYGAIIGSTLAEEMLFRGFLAGLLIARLGFARGNTVQAILFLAPHALLLIVSVAFWPLLPAQLVAGWLLGWLRLPQRVHRPRLDRPRRREHPRPHAPGPLTTCRNGSSTGTPVAPGQRRRARGSHPCLPHPPRGVLSRWRRGAQPDGPGGRVGGLLHGGAGPRALVRVGKAIMSRICGPVRGPVAGSSPRSWPT